jgi:hypothetical protein
LLLLQKQQCLVLERTGFGIKTYETAHSHSLPLSKEKRVQGKKHQTIETSDPLRGN